MHDSNYENIDQIRQLAEAMAAAVSPEIYLAVRTPAQLRGILRTKTPLASSQTGDGSLASRLGLFNDGMLGSVYDLGTYDDTPLTSSSTPGEKGSRSDELIYQYKLCQYVPNGGEVTVDNEYNDLENAIADLATMHVSYLNAEHDPEVLSKWKNSVYTGSDIFSGVNGFDYMSAHLGYRYRLKTSSLAFRSLLDDTARLYLTIENTGFSSAYRTFETTLVLKNENTGESEDLETNIDNTSIAGNDESIFRLELDVRSLKKGTYTLELKMTDPATKTVIHFANTGYETSDTHSCGEPSHFPERYFSQRRRLPRNRQSALSFANRMIFPSFFPPKLRKSSAIFGSIRISRLFFSLRPRLKKSPGMGIVSLFSPDFKIRKSSAS